MTWERSLLRVVPLFLGIASVGLALTSNSSQRAVLAGVVLVIGALMALAVLFYEREIRRSEHRLRVKIAGRQIEAPSNSMQTWRSASDHEHLSFDNVSVRDLSMESASMVEASFIGASLRHCNLSEARLSHADFSAALLLDNLFAGVSLRSAKMKSVEARRCNFDDSRLNTSDWTEAVVEKSSFRRVSMSGAEFASTRLEECDFTSTNATSVNFSNAVLEGCSLESMDLTNADFSHARFVGINIDSVDLSESILDHTSIDIDDEGDHAFLISRLLHNVLGKKPGNWIIFDASACFVQAALEEGGLLRCEAVNFDSWTAWKKSRKMTENMIMKLDDLGFSLESDRNFVHFFDVSKASTFDSAGRLLANALQDVYGISPRAPLEITASAFDDSDTPPDDAHY